MASKRKPDPGTSAGKALAYITANPGCTSKDVTHFVGVNTSAVNALATSMRCIKRRKVGKATYCWPAGHPDTPPDAHHRSLVNRVSKVALGATLSRLVDETTHATEVRLLARLSALEGRVEALEVLANLAPPEKPVDAETLAARQRAHAVYLQMGKYVHAESVLVGKHDDTDEFVHAFRNEAMRDREAKKLKETGT